MGFSGPVALDLIAVGYVLDNLYDEVDDKRYFIERIKYFISTKIAKMMESQDGETNS